MRDTRNGSSEGVHIGRLRKSQRMQERTLFLGARSSIMIWISSFSRRPFSCIFTSVHKYTAMKLTVRVLNVVR